MEFGLVIRFIAYLYMQFETLQALEDHFGDSTLLSLAMAFEQLAHHVYPTLPEDHIRREAL
jgi:hypothetical protein